jgi:hypothetical protein
MDKTTQNFRCNFNVPIDLVDKIKIIIMCIINGQGKEWKSIHKCMTNPFCRN